MQGKIFQIVMKEEYKSNLSFQMQISAQILKFFIELTNKLSECYLSFYVVRKLKLSFNSFYILKFYLHHFGIAASPTLKVVVLFTFAVC